MRIDGQGPGGLREQNLFESSFIEVCRVKPWAAIICHLRPLLAFTGRLHPPSPWPDRLRVGDTSFTQRLTDEKVTNLAKQFGGVSVAAISKLLSRAALRREEDQNWNGRLDELERKCRKNAAALKE